MIKLISSKCKKPRNHAGKSSNVFLCNDCVKKYIIKKQNKVLKNKCIECKKELPDDCEGWCYECNEK